MRAKNCASANGIQVCESANCSAFSIYPGIVSGHVWDRTRPKPWNLQQPRYMRTIQVKMLWSYWYDDRRSEAPLYIKCCRTKRTLCFQSTLSQSLFWWIVENSDWGIPVTIECERRTTTLTAKNMFQSPNSTLKMWNQQDSAPCCFSSDLLVLFKLA